MLHNILNLLSILDTHKKKNRFFSQVSAVEMLGLLESNQRSNCARGISFSNNDFCFVKGRISVLQSQQVYAEKITKPREPLWLSYGLRLFSFSLIFFFIIPPKSK
jgi:hypothetical protein